MSERKPLTLEELRKMDGKPVLVESDSDYIPGGVYLCNWCDWKEEARLWSYEGENWFIGKYDKGVKVYAYAEPHRLDRSVWEPCEQCRNGNTIIDIPVCDEFRLVYKGKSNEQMHFLFQFPFCPHCGRPLTDAAWDALENRLEGAE